MAGRGRGQTRAKMLESMGVQRSEMHQQSHAPGQEVGAGRGDGLTPSCVYPPLQFQPLPLPPPTPESEYRLTLFKLDLERMRNSKFWVREEKKETDMERYSDRYKPRDEQPPLDLDWSRLPKELNPHHRPKRKAAKGRSKSGKRVRLDGETVADMEKRLKELESKEKEGTGKQDGDEEAEDEEEDSKENEEEVEDEDEELDEGTDYAQQYFDNGEEYGGGDDDDAGDDGGYY